MIRANWMNLPHKLVPILRSVALRSRRFRCISTIKSQVESPESITITDCL